MKLKGSSLTNEWKKRKPEFYQGPVKQTKQQQQQQ